MSGPRPAMLRRYRHFVVYARRQTPWLLAIVVLTLTSSALHVLHPWPLKFLVDSVLAEKPALPNFLAGLEIAPNVRTLVLLTAAASLVLHLVVSVVDLALSWSWVTAGQRMVYELGGDLLHRYLRRSLAVSAKHPVGDALERISTDSYCVYSAVETVLVSPGQQIATLVVVGAVAWQIDPWLTFLTLGVAPLLAFASVAMAPRLKRRALAQREAQSQLSSFVHQTLTSLPIVQTFASEPRNSVRFHELAESVVGHSRLTTLEQGAFGLVNGLIVTVGAALVLWQAGLRVLAGAISVGSVLVYLSYLYTVRGAFLNLFGMWAKLKTVEASLDRSAEILEALDFVPEPKTPRPLPALSRQRGASVRFDGVSFGYNPGQAVLQGIDLDIAPGETLAIVGATGAGKSTLVALVPRLFDPWQGRISIDGLDVRDVTLADLRGRMSVVLQEPFLLPTSVAANIAFGCRMASREEIERAACLARADEFIREMPGGYDALLGERGVTLSGGQRQRIGIARALVRRSPLLILDEPTSALDAETESLLFEGLGQLDQATTVILVAHRLATIRRADRIAVLDGGRVVELGTHADLLAQGEYYARLWQLASGGETAP